METQKYTVDIDFDEASRRWRANKKRVGLSFQYCCGEERPNGEFCKRAPGHRKHHEK